MKKLYTVKQAGLERLTFRDNETILFFNEPQETLDSVPSYIVCNLEVPDFPGKCYSENQLMKTLACARYFKRGDSEGYNWIHVDGETAEAILEILEERNALTNEWLHMYVFRNTEEIQRRVQ